MYYLKKLYYILILSFLISCAEKSTTESNNQESPKKLHQIDGCMSNLLKSTASEDSIFNYAFDDSLIIDFCVSSNCCPENSRFNLSSDTQDNIISITIEDTAAHLCHCICPYFIHAEFTDLSLNQYIIACYYDSVLKYHETVIRN